MLEKDDRVVVADGALQQALRVGGATVEGDEDEGRVVKITSYTVNICITRPCDSCHNNAYTTTDSAYLGMTTLSPGVWQK